MESLLNSCVDALFDTQSQRLWHTVESLCCTHISEAVSRKAPLVFRSSFGPPRLTRQQRQELRLRERQLSADLLFNETVDTGSQSFKKKQAIYHKTCQTLRESSAVLIQAVYRGYRIRRPLSYSPMPPQDHLSRALSNLDLSRQRAGRSNDLSLYTISQLRQEKRDVKNQLKFFDEHFHRKYNRMPIKQEKEPLRQLYQHYNSVKQLVQTRSKTPSPTSSSTSIKNTAPSSEVDAPSDVDQAIRQLKAEKRQLQSKLSDFEREFISHFGRKVKFRRDILPVESDYRRYKAVKSSLEQLQTGTCQT